MSSVLKFIPVMHQNTAPPTHILFFKNAIIYYATIKNNTKTDFGGQNTEKREKLCVCVCNLILKSLLYLLISEETF